MAFTYDFEVVATAEEHARGSRYSLDERRGWSRRRATRCAVTIEDAIEQTHVREVTRYERSVTQWAQTPPNPGYRLSATCRRHGSLVISASHSGCR